MVDPSVQLGSPVGVSATSSVRPAKAEARSLRRSTRIGPNLTVVPHDRRGYGADVTEVDDLILVSVDDHVVEPPDMFDGHIPDRYRDAAPKVIAKEDGTETWMFEGQEATNVGLNAVAGRPPD